VPDWQALHDEYIAGGISQRKLAAKYGIDYGRIRDKSIRDGWVKDRERAMSKAQAKVEQKIATTAADNATIAARIKEKLLRKLEKELDSLPDSIGTETRQSMIERDKGKTKEATKVFKLRDLAAAYRDLTADMVSTETAGSDLMRDFVEASRRRLGNG
jgi:hypothetical protein